MIRPSFFLVQAQCAELKKTLVKYCQVKPTCIKVQQSIQYYEKCIKSLGAGALPTLCFYHTILYFTQTILNFAGLSLILSAVLFLKR